MRQYLLLSAALILATAPAHAQHADHAGHGSHAQHMAAESSLAAAIAAPHRSAANKARDAYRHPAETLAFFGVKPTDTVVEISPGGGGWYTEILAPYLAKGGTLYLAQPEGRYLTSLKAKIAGDPATYGKVKWADFPITATTVPDGSADVLLTFRNVHNWIMDKDPTLAERAFASFFRALKPGGVLGVVDHRLPETSDSALEKSSGYTKRSTIVALAEKAGFKLAAESEINANPKDKADGKVWRLPPTLGEGDANRAAYVAIGESDRMTLKFVKPKG